MKSVPIPPSNPKYSYKIDSFVGGLNTRDKDFDLAPDEATVINNCRIDDESIKKREGHAILGVSSGATKITGLYQYTKSTTDYWLKVYGTKLRLWSGTAWGDVATIALTTTLDTYFETFPVITGSATQTGTATSATLNTLVDSGSGWTVDAYADLIVKITANTGSGQYKRILGNTADTLTIEGKWDTTPDSTSTFSIYAVADGCLIANGTDYVQKYTGVAADSGTITTIPKFKFMRVHKNRLFGVTADSSRVWFSDLGLAESFPDLNYIDVPGTGNITGLAVCADQLIIFKTDSINVISGDYPEVFRRINRSNHIGCIASRSIAEGNNQLFFLSRRGIEEFGRIEADQLGVSLPLSDKITSTLTGYADWDKAAGIVFDNKYFLSMNTNQANTVIHDIDLSTALQRPVFYTDSGYNAYVWAVFDDATTGLPELYHGDSTIGKVYQSETGNDDDGADITMAWEGKAFNPTGDKAREVKMKKSYLFADKAATSNPTAITLSLEGNDDGYTDIVTTDQETVEEEWTRSSVNLKARTFKPKLTYSDSYNPLSINCLEFIFKPKKLK